MRPLVIAANWKMNILPSEAGTFVDTLLPLLEDAVSAEVILCPPYPALPIVSDRLRGSAVKAGAQNVHYEAAGAFTGEVSPPMLRELCERVIIGHSERRRHFGETDELIAKKVAAAIGAGLKPIVCVGETLEEREAGDATVVVQRQIRGATRDLPSLAGVMVAYEPVWAIGTGAAASPSDAQRIMEFARGLLHEDFGRGALEMPMLYGGSMDGGNVGAFVSQPDIDGGLVGSASLDPRGFAVLVRNAIDASR